MSENLAVNYNNQSYYLSNNTVANIKKNKLDSNSLNSQNEEYHHKKRTYKKAGIITGASALSLILSGALFYKFSPKMLRNGIKNLNKFLSDKYLNASKNSNTQKFYKASIKSVNWFSQKINAVNNFNSFKDIMFNRFCKMKKMGGENSFLSKAGKKVTAFFDSMAQNTVYSGYRKADMKYSKLFDKMYESKSKFTSAEWKLIEKDMANINSLLSEGFSPQSVSKRLRAQKKLMNGLDEKVMERIKGLVDKESYSKDLKNDFLFLDNNFKFYSEDILSYDQKRISQGVNKIKRNITHDTNTRQGFVQQLIKRFEGKADNYQELVEGGKSAQKTLEKAINNETKNYFEKNRDLSLGGAPTDILSILLTSAFTGAIIANANNKEERISKTLTKGIPIVGAFTTSLLMSANLVAGTKAIVAAGVSGILISKLGEYIDDVRKNQSAKREMKFNKRLQEELKKLNFIRDKES